MERCVVSPDSALASDIFDQFCNASTLKSMLSLYRRLCDTLNLRPTHFPQFYPRLRNKLRSWRAQALWSKFDKRASHKCYGRGHACADTRVFIIGAGPCGLRAAIEAQLLGAKVVVVEKRDRISRNNVLHLWPFVIHDLRALGAKKFFGKFCAGAIDHISIRQLQVILLKVALLLGVELHIGVGFEGLVPPPDDQSTHIGWRAQVSPADHPVSQYEFDVLIGADGKRNTLSGFGRKEFRGKLAIAITANFLNRRSEAEARVEEISGVAFIFNQKFFKDLYQATGIDLENIVYYKDDTHYFVMTAKKHSLLDKGVIIEDQADTARLLSPDNVNKDALMEYAREAADFSTKYELPQLEFAVNHYGQPDVAMFDFTSMYAAENASRVQEKHGHRLLVQIVGDSLLEPFWPTGSGCARGFLSCLDACWAIRSWGNDATTPLEVLAERESIYRLLAQTTPENLNKDFNAYTIEPHTRYPNLNPRAVLPGQVRNLVDTDNQSTLEVLPASELPSKRRRKESQVHPDTLLLWLKRQVALYDNIKVDRYKNSFRNGLVLAAIINRYRPELLSDVSNLHPDHCVTNNQLVFEILERELNIPAMICPAELAVAVEPDEQALIAYLSMVYDAFRGEIPHVRHKSVDDLEEIVNPARRPIVSRVSRTRLSGGQQKKRGSLERQAEPPQGAQKTVGRLPRKRRSHDKDAFLPESIRRREDLERQREERQQRRRMLRHLSTQSFVRSMQMLQAGGIRDEGDDEKQEDFAITVYRQHAPQFSERVKDLERKLVYQPALERESRVAGPAEVKRGGPDEKFSSRIKEIEAKFKGTAPSEKKPKDLLRSIGKIEQSDWNVQVIEKKMEENKMGRGKAKGAEKVPKWSREKFADKFSAVERKLRARSNKEDEKAKFAEIDDTLKRIDRKIREGSTLDGAGVRGANKVSAMAEQLANKLEPAEPPIIEIKKSGSRNAVVLPQPSESCHFCGKRVYLMERMSAEGRFFHRGCFRCEYCATSLRPNNYAFDRDGKFGSRFVCSQHYGTYGVSKGARARRKSEDIRAAIAAETELTRSEPDHPMAAASPKIPPSMATPKATSLTATPSKLSALAAGATPERVEFENLAGVSEDDLSEACRPVPGAFEEMDEEAWTDHNFGASCADDDSSSEEDSETTSDSEEDEAGFEEALGEPLSVEETRQLAETWKRRYSQRSGELAADGKLGPQDVGSEISEEDSGSAEEDGWSCDRGEVEEDDSSTATEGDAVARELLRQEARLRERALKQRNRSQGSDTEVNSDCTSTDSGSEEEVEEEEEEENLATEIETDSEFELDNSLPTIVIDSELQVCHVKTGGVRGNLSREAPANKLPNSKRPPPSKPSVPPPEMTPAALKHRPNNFPGLDLQLRRHKELLNRTNSTEGIASKMSLELKKRYLLGGDTLGFNKNVQKSGSASALDSRFRNFVDQISEQQKLLQPAASPSPTMQAFLEGQTKLSPKGGSPLLTSMSSSNILQANRAETLSKLPKVPSSFVHICGKKEALLSPPEIKISADLDEEATPIVETKENLFIAQEDKGEKILPAEQNGTPVEAESEKISDLEKEKNEDLTPNVEEINKFPSLDNDKPDQSEGHAKQEKEEVVMVETNILDPDYRPRSPPLETSIIVPDISQWKDKVQDEGKKSEEVSSEESSEESESSESSYDDSVEEIPPVKTVPRLEITDSEGGVLQTVIPSQDLSPDKPDDLAETELSDWAQEAEENSVGDFDEFNVEAKNVTVRRPKLPLGNPTLALEDDLSENSLGGGMPKVDIVIVPVDKSYNKADLEEIPRRVEIDTEFIPSTVSAFDSESKIEPLKSIGATIDDIDFMDSGEDESDAEHSSSSPEKARSGKTSSSETKNEALIEGYRKLNDNTPDVVLANDSSTPESLSKSSDDFGTTPDTELENLVLAEAINSKLAKTSDEESLLLVDTDTTVSDVTTLVSSLNNANQNNCQTSRPFVDPSYEAHVKRLQGRISPFSNAKDSIDIRKSRKSSTSSSTPSPSHSAREELAKKKSLSPVKKTHEALFSQNGPKSPSSLPPVDNGFLDSVEGNANVLDSEVSQNNNVTKESKTSENVKIKDSVSPAKLVPNTPSTSRKLEEISKERSKQKDLIADLVIGKLGSNSLERKRSSSGGPGIRKRLSSRSPTRSPRCSLFGPPVPPPPKPSAENSPPVPPPPSPGKLRLEDMECVMPRYNDKTQACGSSSILRPKQTNHVEDGDDDVFVTPRNVATKPPRPISVYATFKTPEKGVTKLPETPLTHPEAFSCPDIRRAIFAEEGREKAREEARARARLLSDQELGLSPQDPITLSALRDKARRKPDEDSIKQTPVAPPRTKRNKSESSGSKFYVDCDTPSLEEPPHTDPVVVTKRSGNKGKQSKDRERRKSLIQAMSEFFSRKKDGSSSPSKSNPSKDKSKDKDHKGEEEPPPVPPPPQGYQGCHLISRDGVDESGSEGEDSRGGPGSTSIDGSSLRRSARSAKKMARQAQLKRLRMAHELQRQLEELEQKQQRLEKRGVQLEKALRGEGTPTSSPNGGGEVALLQEWFELMRERSELRRCERELGMKAQELELLERHARLQAEIRDRMAADDSSKTSEDVAAEARILDEMLEIVEQRNSLVRQMEEDRQRYLEEDKDLEAQMTAKGLRLSPIRKESHV